VSRWHIFMCANWRLTITTWHRFAIISFYETLSYVPLSKLGIDNNIKKLNTNLSRAFVRSYLSFVNAHDSHKKSLSALLHFPNIVVSIPMQDACVQHPHSEHSTTSLTHSFLHRSHGYTHFRTRLETRDAIIAVVRNYDLSFLYSKFGVVTATPVPHSRQQVPRPMNGFRALAPHEVVGIN